MFLGVHVSVLMCVLKRTRTASNVCSNACMTCTRQWGFTLVRNLSFTMCLLLVQLKVEYMSTNTISQRKEVYWKVQIQYHNARRYIGKYKYNITTQGGILEGTNTISQRKEVYWKVQIQYHNARRYIGKYKYNITTQGGILESTNTISQRKEVYWKADSTIVIMYCILAEMKQQVTYHSTYSW